MSRATSAALYGTARHDLGRVPASSRRAWGLRSQSSLDGYYPAGKPARRVRERIGSDNLVLPASGVADDDDVVIVRKRAAVRVHEDSIAPSAAGIIRMADLD